MSISEKRKKAKQELRLLREVILQNRRETLTFARKNCKYALKVIKKAWNPTIDEICDEPYVYSCIQDIGQVPKEWL